MPPQETQVNDMTPEDAKASLGIATYLQDQLMPQGEQEAPMEAPQEAETAPEAPPEPEVEETPPEEDMGAKMAEMEKSMTQKLDDIRKELKEDNQREMDSLKKMISDGLKE